MTEHSPGGKVRRPLPPGIEGGAEFSLCSTHRFLLWRRPEAIDPTAGRILWVGMNPSTADADTDDPTCAKEQRFSRGWGFQHYRKVNVMSFRATDSRDLIRRFRDGGNLGHRHNFIRIADEAGQADLIVACWGRIHPELQRYVDEAWRAIVNPRRAPIYCLGVNRDGSPKHPLYLRGDLRLRPFGG